MTGIMLNNGQFLQYSSHVVCESMVQCIGNTICRYILLFFVCGRNMDDESCVRMHCDDT